MNWIQRLTGFQERSGQLPVTVQPQNEPEAARNPAHFAQVVGSEVAASRAVSLGSLQFCAGIWAGCVVNGGLTCAEPARSAITPEYLSSVGRALIEDGEHVSAIDLVDGKLQLIPVASFDIRGRPGRETYECEIVGPDISVTKRIPKDGIIHHKWSIDARMPWKSIGPLEAASASARLAIGAELKVSSELNARSGSIIPTPEFQGGDAQKDFEETIPMLIRNLNGGTALLPSFTARRLEGPVDAAFQWRPVRLGPNPSEQLVAVQQSAWKGILSACLLSPAMLEGDGRGQREAWRIFGQRSLSPVLIKIAWELTQKLETQVKFNATTSLIPDLQALARAMQVLQEAGADPVKLSESLGVVPEAF